MVSPLPKVSVATTIATASAAPKSAERTGTAVRPRPGSSAKRMPATAETGAPEFAASRSSFLVRFGPWPLRLRSEGLVAARNVVYEDCVRLAAATEPRAIPPISPISSTRVR